MSTSGLTAGSSPGTSDITNAIANQKIEPFQGRDPETGEKILAVSCPLVFNGRVVGVMRLVTSLRLVNRQSAGGVHHAGGVASSAWPWC